LIHITAQRFDDRDNEKEAGVAYAAISAEAQEGRLLPLVYDLDCEEEVNADKAAHYNEKRRGRELLNRYPTQDTKQEYGKTNAIEVVTL
jgi:hypothetical protein